MTEQPGHPNILPRQFEWDPAKSAQNEAKHGLPLDLAVLLFDGPTLERDDTRRDYGERRILATGTVSGEVLMCVYTDREPGIRRIISLRFANRRERRDYRATHPG